MTQDSLKRWMVPTLAHYKAVNAVFEREFGRSLFAIGGTVLGAIRSKGFITFDKDMDVAFISDMKTPEEVRVEFVAIILRLLQLGHRVSILNRGKKLQPRHAKWWSDDGYYVDIFPAFFDERGYYSRPTFVRIPLRRGDVLPLAQVPFEDSTIYVPRNVEKKLKLIFGEGWREPDPDWQKPEFPEVRDMRRRLAFRTSDIQAIAAASRPEDAEVLRTIIEERARG